MEEKSFNKTKSPEKELTKEKSIQNLEDKSYNDFDINLKYPKEELKYHSLPINCLTVLNDGRFASGSNDCTIIIYNIKTFKPDITIKAHTECVNCLAQLSSGILISGSDDKTIKLFNIKENEYNLIQALSYHTDGVNKIIELKNGRLVSCSYDKSIIIYSKENNEYIKDFDFKTNGPNGPVIQTKENEICYYEGTDNTICFYDLNERKIITSINNVNDACHYYDCLIMISKDLLLMTGDSRLTIINCNSHNIIRNINAPGSGNIWAACLLNNDILLAADDNHRITQWKIENDNLKFISKLEEAHDRAVRALKKLGKGLIISADGKGVVKVW